MMAKIVTICAGALIATMTGATAQTPVERGDYLVNAIGACGNCHTPRAQGVPVMEKQLSGGFQTFDEPAFVVKGANITPDRDTGIGAWSDAEIKAALIDGVRPNGTPLATVMPYPFYRIMTANDLDAIVAYLRSVPPVRNNVQRPIYKSAQFDVPYPGAEKPMSEEDLNDPVKRGLYLSSIAHCMACHARRSEDEPPDFKNALGKGGREFKGPWGVTVTANITSHPTSGLGSWSDDEIKRALTEGVSRDGRRLKPPMIDYVAYYKKWTDTDMSALIAWIRSIPPIE